jgi:hypothetical protein
MPKGEKIRPKQEIDQLRKKWISYHLRILKKVELEFFFVKILLFVSFVKSWPLVGRMVDYGKRGVFEIFDQILFEQLSLCLNKCV